MSERPFLVSKHFDLYDFSNVWQRDCVRKVAVLTAIIFEYLNNLAKKQ